MLPLPLLLHHSPLSFLLPPHPPRMSRQSSLVAPAFFFPVRFFSRTDLGDFFAPFQPVSAHHPQTQPPVKSAGLRWWSAFTHTGRQAGRQGRSAGRQRILFLFLFPFSLSLPSPPLQKTNGAAAQLHSFSLQQRWSCHPHPTQHALVFIAYSVARVTHTPEGKRKSSATISH